MQCAEQTSSEAMLRSEALRRGEAVRKLVSPTLEEEEEERESPREEIRPPERGDRPGSERGRTVPLPDGPQLRVTPERTVPGQAPERTVPGKGSLYLKSKTQVQSFQVQSARGPIVHGHWFFPIKSKPRQLPERTVPGDVSLSGSWTSL